MQALVLQLLCLSFISSTFGELKTVRLPKKMAGTGRHRGFGFVDFFTKQDAKVRSGRTPPPRFSFSFLALCGSSKALPALPPFLLCSLTLLILHNVGHPGKGRERAEVCIWREGQCLRPPPWLGTYRAPLPPHQGKPASRPLGRVGCNMEEHVQRRGGAQNVGTPPPLPLPLQMFALGSVSADHKSGWPRWALLSTVHVLYLGGTQRLWLLKQGSCSASGPRARPRCHRDTGPTCWHGHASVPVSLP